MRDGSSDFAMSAKVSVRRSPPRSAANLDCASCMRPGRTGTGRRSPSDRSPAMAVAWIA